MACICGGEAGWLLQTTHSLSLASSRHQQLQRSVARYSACWRQRAAAVTLLHYQCQPSPSAVLLQHVLLRRRQYANAATEAAAGWLHLLSLLQLLLRLLCDAAVTARVHARVHCDSRRCCDAVCCDQDLAALPCWVAGHLLLQLLVAAHHCSLQDPAST